MVRKLKMEGFGKLMLVDSGFDLVSFSPSVFNTDLRVASGFEILVTVKERFIYCQLHKLSPADQWWWGRLAKGGLSCITGRVSD